jgi:threonine/homoserine/homoserine lactone efflux protein
MNSSVALAAAAAILVAIPGPNVALTIANSIRYGLRAGIITVAGAVIGVGLQLALVVFGLAALLELFASALLWVKWLGVAYLLWLGIRTWREPAEKLDEVRAEPMLFGNACLIAVLNPKTLMFNAAFLPQFVPPDAGIADLLQAAAILLTVIFLGDMLWALFASRARLVLQRYSALRNRLAGAFLVFAAAGLALTRR